MITHNKIKVYRIKPYPVYLHIETWDIKQACEDLKNVNGAYGFRFEEWELSKAYYPGGCTVEPNLIRKSGVYYIDAFTETVEDIKAKLKINPNPHEENILGRMEMNGWKIVVRNIHADKIWYEPFFEEDEILGL